MRVPITAVQVRLNRAMRPAYAGLDLDDGEQSLPDALREVAAQGVAILGDRVYLRAHWASRATTAQTIDRWSAERWVNEITLDGGGSRDEGIGGPQLLGWGIVTALALMGDARARHCRLDLQADVGLRAGTRAADHPTGAVHLYSLQAAGDDLSPGIDEVEHPLVTITLRARSAG
jgi:hypothetical protein